MIPLGYRKDAKSMKSMPTFGVRYKALGPYKRKMEVWNVSGAGGQGNYVIEDDLHNYNLRAHIGFQGMAANQMILLRPQ